MASENQLLLEIDLETRAREESMASEIQLPSRIDVIMRKEKE